MRIGTLKNLSRRRKSPQRHELSSEARRWRRLIAGDLGTRERCYCGFETGLVFNVQGFLTCVDLF